MLTNAVAPSAFLSGPRCRQVSLVQANAVRRTPQIGRKVLAAAAKVVHPSCCAIISSLL